MSSGPSRITNAERPASGRRGTRPRATRAYLGRRSDTVKGARQEPETKWAYDLENKLVLGVASSALFEMSDADEVFRERGEARYREYQEEHLANPLQPGVAFPSIKRLLSLNDLSETDR